jgi:hypothetical protein
VSTSRTTQTGRSSHRLREHSSPAGGARLELNNRHLIVREFQPARVSERDGDMMIDRSQIEPLTGRISTEPTVARGGEVDVFPSLCGYSRSLSCATGCSAQASRRLTALARTAHR